jgi:hypothetical protein
MHTNKKLAIESLERREVLTGMPGVDGYLTIELENTLVDHEPSHDEVGYFDGSDVGLSVDSPRDTASGLPTGKRTAAAKHVIIPWGYSVGGTGTDSADLPSATDYVPHATAVDQLFAERQTFNASHDAAINL